MSAVNIIKTLFETKEKITLITNPSFTQIIHKFTQIIHNKMGYEFLFLTYLNIITTL